MTRFSTIGLFAVFLLALLPITVAAQPDWSNQFGYGGLTGNAYDVATDASRLAATG